MAAKKAEAASAKTPEAGAVLITIKNGCTGCHSVDASPLTGPTWFGLYGSQVELADGTSLIADDAYITESILEHYGKEVAGFAPTIMPPYVFTEEENRGHHRIYQDFEVILQRLES